MGKVVTREWRKAKSAKLEFVFVSAFRDNSCFGLNILGPLCLWQCFKMMDTEIPCSRELESSGDKTVSRCKRVFLWWLIEHGWGWII